MRSVLGSFSCRVLCLVVCALGTFVLPRPSLAQTAPGQAMPDSRATKDFGSTGQLAVLVQDATGAPFFQGATIKLLTRDIATTLSMVSDPNGHASFTALPAGQYLMEISAPGYGTVERQVLIAGTTESQKVVVSMVPTAVKSKAKATSAVNPRAVKESEKGLHALQFDLLDEAQLHLTRALAIDPNFADGHYLMGLVLLRQKDFARAAAYFQKSLILSPAHAPALLALGEAQYFDHDFSHAAESLQKYLQDQPGSPQAPVAQKYLDSLRRSLPAQSGDGAVEISVAALGSPSAAADPKSSATASAPAAPDAPSVVELEALTEINWAPPDVDAERVALDSPSSCQLSGVTHSAGERVQELVRNVDRFTATERIEHFRISPMGIHASEETRKFNYLVEIRRDLAVEEYRNGTDTSRQFPDEIATMGLPSLVLIFHPDLQSSYDFACEGRGTWQGKPAWVVHFKQRTDHSNGMLVYQVGGRSVAVSLKGRAWIDADTSQVMAMESDIVRPIPEIRLVRDHQLIQYGPVKFRNKNTELWLPKSADWYCFMSGHRFHRRHSFSNFLLFSVDEKQNITTPPVPDAPAANPG
jgi:tetratricopeptide (TPR) repeat protein